MMNQVAKMMPEGGGSFWVKVKETLNPANLMARFNISRSGLIDMGLYLGVGFLTGFLLKRYGKLVALFVFMLLGLVALQQLEIIHFAVNWPKVTELFGIQKVGMPGASIFDVYWVWVKANVALVLTFSIGFLVGIRVG